MNMKISKKLALLSTLVLSTMSMFSQEENMISPRPAYTIPENYKTVKTSAYSSGYHDYYFCYADDKVGMIDDRKRVIIPIEYDEVKYFNREEAQYLIRKGDNWGLVDRSGFFLIQPLLASIKQLDSEYIETTEHDGIKGKFFFEGGWANDMKILRAYLAQKYEYGKYFIPRTDSTTKAIPVDAYWTSGEFHDGLMPVMDKNSKKLGFINTKGEWAIPYSIKMDAKPYLELDQPYFSGGYLVLCMPTELYSYDYTYKIYDKSGTLLWSMKRNQRQGNVSYVRKLCVRTYREQQHLRFQIYFSHRKRDIPRCICRAQFSV